MRLGLLQSPQTPLACLMQVHALPQYIEDVCHRASSLGAEADVWRVKAQTDAVHADRQRGDGEPL